MNMQTRKIQTINITKLKSISLQYVAKHKLIIEFSQIMKNLENNDNSFLAH